MASTAVEIIEELTIHGAYLFKENGKLLVRAPKDYIQENASLMHLIKSHKQSLLLLVPDVDDHEARARDEKKRKELCEYYLTQLKGQEARDKGNLANAQKRLEQTQNSIARINKLLDNWKSSLSVEKE